MGGNAIIGGDIMKINIKYVTLKPTTLLRNTLYYFKDAGAVKHSLTDGMGVPMSLGESSSPALDIEMIIRASSQVDIVKDIRTMNETIIATPIDSVFLVVDASSVGLRNSGGLYVFSSALGQTVLVAEYVSLPKIITWDELIGNPESTPAAIDEAVSHMHGHTNKTTLDKWSEDPLGIPLFDGERVNPVWKTRTW